jgi:hypothetical protein
MESILQSENNETSLKRKRKKKGKNSCWREWCSGKNSCAF